MTRRTLALIATAHVVVALLALHNAWIDPTHAVVGPANVDGPGYGGSGVPNGDNVQLVWFVRWMPFALSQLHNPLLTTYLNAPDGANLMWNQLMPLPSLLVAPVTVVFGAAAGLAVIGTLALAVCGLAATACARRFVTATAPAVVAGLIYEVSPFALAESQGHQGIVLGAALAPVALLLLMDVLRGRRSPLTGGVLLGVAAAATYYTWSESVLVTAIIGGLAMLLAAALSPRGVRSAARPVSMCVGAGAAVGLLLAAPGLVVQLAGPMHLTGAIRPANVVVTDLQNAITPTTVEAIAPGAAIDASHAWTGNSFEWAGYLGIPLLLAVVGTLLWCCRRRDVQWFGLMLVVTFVLSLGPRLHIAGRDTGIPLPWSLATHVPLLQDVLAGRLAWAPMLAATLLLAIGIDRALTNGLRIPALLVTAVVVASLAPASVAVERPVIPPFFTSSDIATVPPGSTALVAPYVTPHAPEAMLWQVASGMRFRMPEGYVLIPGRGGRGLAQYPPETATSRAMELIAAGGTPDLDASTRPELLADLRRWSVRTVIVGDMQHRDAMLHLFSDLLGRAPRDVGGVSIWEDVAV